MGVRLDKLLGKSPFGHVQDMMRLTNKVTYLIPKLFMALESQDLEKTLELSKQVSEMEGEIDDVKHKIRQIVSESLFFPFPKRDFLELIFSMDSISDRSEKLAKLFTVRPLHYPDELKPKIQEVLETVEKLREYLSNILLDELPGLVEASFRGPEAKAVAQMVHGISEKAHELEEVSHEAMVTIFQPGSGLEPTEVILWNKIIERLESVGLAFEKTATILRMLMEK